MIDFPIQAQDLENWVPHRGPMIWIDEVTWVNRTEGECRVTLRPSALYMDHEGIRPSSTVEWIAQSYAFVRAVQSIQGLIPAVTNPKHAFLVAIRNAQFDFLKNREILGELKSLLIRVRCERDLAPFSLIQGSVHTPSGTLLATAQLKLYSPA